ncbi:dTDP-4-dehydrorhamnose reductase [Clostridium felsineum]|uniref:dTDP-4-dehydrorhamnose reductase n=1 Tax=Clostridium felsineum TaxID=36839 RepID=UPI00214DAAC5|nr:dTDP-4-dehydrorhamnose reductase [Clostridium felsineum]MCR3758716.1 dTDP-4-dehydrorhamnose reductase [Clostridium felsineum]
MKILITGAKGQVGSQLIESLHKEKTELGQIPEELKKAEVIGKSSKEMDISDISSVRKIVKEVKPDIIINAAAYTNVDAAETNEKRALEVNAFGAKNLAIACEEIKAKLVHISSDYVFSGEGNTPFKETDEAEPKSVYGKSKKMGDDFVKQYCSRYFIVRPAWVYGYYGKNFVYTVIRLSKEKEIVKVVNDQRGNPTNVHDIVHHIFKLMVTEKYGDYNCSGHGECSWHDFARKIVEFSKANCKIEPCSSEEYLSPVKRPTYSSLDNGNLDAAVGDEMRHWEAALKVFIENI